MFRRSLLIALVASGASWLALPSAQAILKVYRFNQVIISDSLTLSPVQQFTPRSLDFETSYAVVDEDGSGNPKLKKLLLSTDRTLTRVVPQLGGNIFVNNKSSEGPVGEFTGTGSTDTTIAWGLLTGWTISGAFFCKSAPALICTLGGLIQGTQDPQLLSPFWDLGTWTFHGTGFTGTPYIQRTYEPGNPGNDQRVTLGIYDTSGRIPALPLFAIACLGGSLVAGGLVALRRGDG